MKRKSRKNRALPHVRVLAIMIAVIMFGSYGSGVTAHAAEKQFNSHYTKKKFLDRFNN